MDSLPVEILTMIAQELLPRDSVSFSQVTQWMRQAVPEEAYWRNLWWLRMKKLRCDITCIRYQYEQHESTWVFSDKVLTFYYESCHRDKFHGCVRDAEFNKYTVRHGIWCKLSTIMCRPNAARNISRVSGWNTIHKEAIIAKFSSMMAEVNSRRKQLNLQA